MQNYMLLPLQEWPLQNHTYVILKLIHLRNINYNRPFNIRLYLKSVGRFPG